MSIVRRFVNALLPLAFALGILALSLVMTFVMGAAAATLGIVLGALVGTEVDHWFTPNTPTDAAYHFSMGFGVAFILAALLVAYRTRDDIGDLASAVMELLREAGREVVGLPDNSKD